MSEETDILHRLRDLSPGYGNVIRDAVAEIEGLREKIDGLREDNRVLREQCRKHIEEIVVARRERDQAREQLAEMGRS